MSEGLLCWRAILRRENLPSKSQLEQTSSSHSSNFTEYLNLAVSLLKNSCPKAEALLLGASIFVDLKKGVLLLKTMKQLHDLNPQSPILRRIISDFSFTQQEARISTRFFGPIDLGSPEKDLSLVESIYYCGDVQETTLKSTAESLLPYKERFKLAMALSDIKYTKPTCAHKIDEFICNKLLIR